MAGYTYKNYWRVSIFLTELVITKCYRNIRYLGVSIWSRLSWFKEGVIDYSSIEVTLKLWNIVANIIMMGILLIFAQLIGS